MLRLIILISFVLVANCATTRFSDGEFTRSSLVEAEQIVEAIRITEPVVVDGETFTPDQARERIASALRLGNHTIQSQDKYIQSQGDKLESVRQDRLDAESDAGFGRYIKSLIFWLIGISIILGVGYFLINKYFPGLRWPVKKL